MKKKIEQFKKWRLSKIHKWAQWYADMIITRLEESTTEWEINFWIAKGYAHDFNMINKYEIYLD